MSDIPRSQKVTLFQMDWDSHKVPLIGDANVGKTSIVTRYTTNQFPETPATTVGVSNVQVTLHYESEELTVNLWDTAGQERFRSLVPLYTRGADLIVLVFSMTDYESFEHLTQWYGKVRTDMRLTCPIVLCGNKTDLDALVPRARAEEWAAEHNCPVVFTSAQTGDNIKDLFAVIAQEIWKATTQSTVVDRPADRQVLAERKQSGCGC
jgi:small GTP-binding protein